MIKSWMLFTTTRLPTLWATNFGLPQFWTSGVLRAIYYLLIIFGLIWLYGRGNFTAPQFVYQGF